MVVSQNKRSHLNHVATQQSKLYCSIRRLSAFRNIDVRTVHSVISNIVNPASEEHLLCQLSAINCSK
jgi:hypothetical protein